MLSHHISTTGPSPSFVTVSGRPEGDPPETVVPKGTPAFFVDIPSTPGDKVSEIFDKRVNGGSSSINLRWLVRKEKNRCQRARMVPI